MEKNPKKGKALATAFQSILNTFKPMKIVNLLEISTSTGDMLAFEGLEPDDVPQAGDVAMFKGEPASGEHIVGESKEVYVFGEGDKAGELLEIKTPDADGEPTVDELKASLAESQKLYNDLLTEVTAVYAKIESGEIDEEDLTKDKRPERQKRVATNESSTASVNAKLEVLKNKRKSR